jgi:hypothetical protein
MYYECVVCVCVCRRVRMCTMWQISDVDVFVFVWIGARNARISMRLRAQSRQPVSGDVGVVF